MEQDSSDDGRVHLEGHLALSLDKQLKQDQRWKALALLSEAYDEWGKGDDSVEVMYVSFVDSIPNANFGIANLY